MRRILRKCELPIRIIPIFVTCRPLGILLRQSVKIPCSLPCVCNGQNLCSVKNLVYHLRCKHCPQDYVGETQTTLQQRMKGDSQMKIHLQQEHGIERFRINEFHRHVNIEILSQGFVDTTSRKITEEFLIKKTEADIEHSPSMIGPYVIG